jgi:hypothetical protein
VKNKAMPRSSIAVSDEVASTLSEVAKEYKQTSYLLANECLESSLKICKEGGNPTQIYGAWKMLQIGKQIGSLQWIGKDLLERIVHEISMEHPEKNLEMWREGGHNFGVLLQLCFPTIQDVVTLMDRLKQSFTIGSVEMVKKRDEVEGEIYELTLRSSLSSEFLFFIKEYWRGILSAYGLDVVDFKITELGAARITFSYHGKLMKSEIIK